MIDVIIPVYNSHNTLYYSLASIAMQNIKDKVQVTIVDDASDKDYNDLLKTFKKDLKIRYLRLDINRGPGFAREYALNNTNNDYVVFMDSDDQFMDCYSLKKMYDSLVLNDLDIVIGSELIEGLGINNKDYYSLHSKIYRRSHIINNDIHFNSSRYSEDNSFNQICINTTDRWLKLDDVLYIYRYNSSSVTQDESKKLEILMSYIFNVIWVVRELEKRNVDKWKIADIISFCYAFSYEDICINDTDFNYDKLYKCCYRLEEIFEKYKDYCSNKDVVKLILGDNIYNQKRILREKTLENFMEFRLKFKRSSNND